MRCSGPRLGPLPDTTGLVQTTASGNGVRVESFTSPVDSGVSLVLIAPQAAAAGGQTSRSLGTFAGPAIVHIRRRVRVLVRQLGPPHGSDRLRRELRASELQLLHPHSIHAHSFDQRSAVVVTTCSHFEHIRKSGT